MTFCMSIPAVQRVELPGTESAMHANTNTMHAVILRYAGHDATQAYSEVHPPETIKNNLPPEKLKGVLDRSTINDKWAKSSSPAASPAKPAAENDKPALYSLINAHDFEVAASQTASKKAWAFYSSAATDLITRDANRSFFDRTWFRPRVLRNVRSVDTRTKILGVDSAIPLFVSPASMAKLIHPDGECAIARACESKGIFQGVWCSVVYRICKEWHTEESLTAICIGIELFIIPDR